MFVGFTICQVGMVRHWYVLQPDGWRVKAALNAFGASLTGVSVVVVTAVKFTEDAWLIALALPLLVLTFGRIRRAYERIGARLELGRIPEPPHRSPSLVVVPVSGLSKLTCQALTAARSLGDSVLAVTVTHPGDEDRRSAEALRRDWELWKPGVELVEIHSERRELGSPFSAYIRTLGDSHPEFHVTVLIPETEPAHVWQRLLQNQRGSVIAHAVRRDTAAVICRLRFRVTTDSP